LVTGSSRGLGLAYCEGLLQAGTAKVYAAAQKPLKLGISDSRIVPITLDVTSPAAVTSAAQSCRDASLLVNNAGELRNSPCIAAAMALFVCAQHVRLRANLYGVRDGE
jgi:NAD(P)-dependent dehydrogenase (short-subunit alcohol dehydrogenase family)